MRLLVIKPEPLARRLLKLAGTTYAAEAGIRIRDKPMPLFQLLVLCMLASKPIGAATQHVPPGNCSARACGHPKLCCQQSDKR